MAELLITEAVNQAEEAIETGNYDGAIEVCQRILGQFPEFAAAHRLMGEAFAERGDFDSAKEAFHRVLERDPQSIPAHVGLGFIAEEREDPKAALAHYQVAWEIDPRRRDLREHVARLSQHVYGQNGRLYLTRAALASLHFHAGRWDRAITEASQVLQEHNSRVDVQIRLAESLWRRGDDHQAMQIASTILRSLPSAVIPLLVQADIHRRRGEQDEAHELLERARRIDPDGLRAADLIIVGFDEQADFLIVDDVPTVDDTVVAEEPAARYAPAPDFTSDLTDTPSAAAAASKELEEASMGEEPPVEEAVGDIGAEEAVVEPEGVQPFRWEDIGDEDLEASDLDVSEMETYENDVEPVAAESEEDESLFNLFSDEEIDQARPPEDRPAGYTGMLRSLETEGVEPFNPLDGEAGDAAADEEGLPDDLAGLGLSEEPAPPETQAEAPEELASAEPDLDAARAESETTFDLNWEEVDQEIEGAIPGDVPHGYTEELRHLDEMGVQPFAFGEEESTAQETGDEAAWSEPEAAGEEADLDFDTLAEGWESDTSDSESADAGLDELVADEERAEAFEQETVPEPEAGDIVADFGPGEGARDTLAATVELSGVMEGVDRIGLDEALVARVRGAKSELIKSGRIAGTTRLPGTGPTIEDLIAAVETEPENPDNRIALAGALIESDVGRSLDEYRWVARNASDRRAEIVDDLLRLAESAGERAPDAHRLLGWLYRTQGDWLSAARQYEQSLSNSARQAR